MVSNTGTWMQRIAQDWLVLQITNSPLAVGITTALQFLPMLLFGLWGGVIADRYPKRTTAARSPRPVMGVLAAVLAVLTLTGAVQVWQVYLLAFGLGLATVVDNPTRQTFVNEMVPHGVGPQRGQPELRQLPARPDARPGGRRGVDQPWSAPAGRSPSTRSASWPSSAACC